MKRTRCNKLTVVIVIFLQYSIIYLLGKTSISSSAMVNGLDIFGIKKRRRIKEQIKRKKQRHENLIIINGIEIIEKKKFYGYSTYVITSSVAIILLITMSSYLFGNGLFGIGKRKYHRNRGNIHKKKGVIDVVVIGCGLPKKSMGWFHITVSLLLTSIQFSNPHIAITRNAKCEYQSNSRTILSKQTQKYNDT